MGPRSRARSGGSRVSRNRVPRSSDKLVPPEKAIETTQAWRQSGERIVVAQGVFDLLHVGHVRHLTAARAPGTRLVVAVADDPLAAARTGPGRPVVRARDRALLIAALRPVDLVVLVDAAGAGHLLDALRPAVVVSDPDLSGGLDERGAADSTGRAPAIHDAARAGVRDLVERVRERYGEDA